LRAFKGKPCSRKPLSKTTCGFILVYLPRLRLQEGDMKFPHTLEKGHIFRTNLLPPEESGSLEALLRINKSEVVRNNFSHSMFNRNSFDLH
jgi:hypothetical protein